MQIKKIEEQQKKAEDLLDFFCDEYANGNNFSKFMSETKSQLYNLIMDLENIKKDYIQEENSEIV